jgi:hypothetical protein
MKLYRIEKYMTKTLIESKVEYKKSRGDSYESDDGARLNCAFSYDICAMYGGKCFSPESGEVVYTYGGDVYFVPEEFIPVREGMFYSGEFFSKEGVYQWICDNLPYYDGANTSFEPQEIEGDIWGICTDVYHVGELLVRRVYRYNSLTGEVLVGNE